MRRGARAFTLPELLIVTAIIAILVAMLGPSLMHSFDVADQNRCSANLYYLSQAITMRRGDAAAGRRSELKVTQWATQLQPYVESGEILICPAGGSSESWVDPEDGSTLPPELADMGDWGTKSQDLEVIDEAQKATKDVAELCSIRTIAGSNTYYTRFEAGPYCLKLSDAQYADAKSKGLLGDADSANYITSKYDTKYKASGDGTSYWLCFEDYGGDQDFKDVMVHVNENEDGSFGLQVCAGSTGHKNSVVRTDDHNTVLVDVPSNASGLQLSVGEQKEDEAVESDAATASTGGSEATSSQGGGVFATSYAMNASRLYPTRGAGKIMLLDYCKYLASAADTWGDARVDPNQDGVPIFARHTHMINVLFSDGSVQLMDPADINPALPSIETRYWLP